MAPQGRKAGFTLMEVMTVVAIIGVVSALALSVIGRRMGDQRAKAAVRSIGNLFELARTEAIRTGQNHIVYLQLAPGDTALLDKAGTPVAALLISDNDADGIPDAGASTRPRCLSMRPARSRGAARSPARRLAPGARTTIRERPTRRPIRISRAARSGLPAASLRAR